MQPTFPDFATVLKEVEADQGPAEDIRGPQFGFASAVFSASLSDLPASLASRTIWKACSTLEARRKRRPIRSTNGRRLPRACKASRRTPFAASLTFNRA